GAADAAAPGGRVGEQITTGPAVADGLAVANGLALGVLDGAVLRSGAVGVEPTSADGVPDGVGCTLTAAGDPISASRVVAVNVKYRLGVALVITHRPRGGANRSRRVDRRKRGRSHPSWHRSTFQHRPITSGSLTRPEIRHCRRAAHGE